MELDTTKPRPSARGGEPAQQREHLARGRDTIRRLIEAGAEVFGRDGFRGASIGDIVARAGISRATFYLYLANKDDLFGALALDAVGRGQHALDDAGQRGEDLVPRATDAVVAQVGADRKSVV